MASRRDIELLLQQVVAEGALVTRSRGGHWKVSNPNNGRSINVSSTPGHDSTVKIARSRLRKIGFAIGSAVGTARRPLPGSDRGRSR